MISPVQHPAPGAPEAPRPVESPSAPPVAVQPSPWPDETYRGWSGL